MNALDVVIFLLQGLRDLAIVVWLFTLLFILIFTPNWRKLWWKYVLRKSLCRCNKCYPHHRVEWGD